MQLESNSVSLEDGVLLEEIDSIQCGLSNSYFAGMTASYSINIDPEYNIQVEVYEL